MGAKWSLSLPIWDRARSWNLHAPKPQLMGVKEEHIYIDDFARGIRA